METFVSSNVIKAEEKLPLEKNLQELERNKWGIGIVDGKQEG